MKAKDLRGVDVDNVQVKVIINELNKLRAEIIDMKIELEMLKADMKIIAQFNNKAELKAVGDDSFNKGKKIDIADVKEEKKKKIKIVELEEKKALEDIPKQVKKKIVEDTQGLSKKVNSANIEFKIVNKKFRKELREELQRVINSEIRYETWLKMGVDNLSSYDGTYRFLAPNSFTKGIIEARYKDIVHEGLIKVFDDVTNLEIISLEE